MKRMAPLRATEQTDVALLDAWEAQQTQQTEQAAGGAGGNGGEDEEVVVVVSSSKRNKKKKKRRRYVTDGSAAAAGAAQPGGSNPNAGSNAAGSGGVRVLDEDQCRRYAAIYRGKYTSNLPLLAMSRPFATDCLWLQRASGK